MSAPPFSVPLLVRGDARHLPLADESVDLIVTSPPYWSLRSYSDHGKHYEQQIGSEPTWQEYLNNLVDCTREWMRVLKPSGSIWLNMGDKYAGGGMGGHGGGRLNGDVGQGVHTSSYRRIKTDTPSKSLLNLPHRYAIRCVDELGLIERQDQVWHKLSHLPESVTDRTCRAHEYLFHLVKQPRYYSAVDEIRESAQDRGPALSWKGRKDRGDPVRYGEQRVSTDSAGLGVNPLGKLPGSVWEIASQPLNVPDHISHARCCAGRKRDGCQDGIDHYAAFPFALVRPIILGWSPRQVCTACGEGRRPVVLKPGLLGGDNNPHSRDGSRALSTLDGGSVEWRRRMANPDRIVGYSCACPDTTAPSRPGVVLDPFGGTAAAPLVAAMHGRTGISVDASWDYSNTIARWRIHDPKERARAAGLDPDAVAKIAPSAPDQLDLFGEAS